MDSSDSEEEEEEEESTVKNATDYVFRLNGQPMVSC